MTSPDKEKHLDEIEYRTTLEADDVDWLAYELHRAWRCNQIMGRALSLVSTTHKTLYPKSTENIAEQALEAVKEMEK
jgi:hypothetical protein